MAHLDDLPLCSSILPWKGGGAGLPWVGDCHVDRTEATVSDLDHVLPRSALVWEVTGNVPYLGVSTPGARADDGTSSTCSNVEECRLERWPLL